MINGTSPKTDYLDRFIFDELPIRGERVILEHSWQELLLRRSYPDNVKKLLGELMATTALLSATIKIEGKLTVQVQAKGALDLLVVQISHLKGVRAVARFDKEGVAGLEGLKELCGEGHIVITIDAPTFKEPYQGIIPLIDNSIKEAIERYFATSEQLETTLYLATSDQAAAGMLLQRLPGEMPDEDAFNRVNHLAATMQDEELLQLPTKELLYRLYSEDDIRVFEPDSYHFECTCSKERTLSMIYQLNLDEVKSILAEQEDALFVDCEFCGKRYLFKESDLDFSLFKSEASESGASD